MHLLLFVCWCQYVTGCRWAGGQFPRPVPVPHIIQGVLGIRFTHIHYTCNMQVFQLFSPVFAVFRPISHVFCTLAPGLTEGEEPAAGTQKQGAGRPRGAATPTQAARGRRRTARAPRPGAPPPRAPGGAAPTGGSATPAQSDRRAASPAGAGRGGARPPWRVPPGRAGGTDYPEPPEARTGGAGGGA